MNPRLFYILLTIAAIIATYLSTKLWMILTYGSVLDTIAVIFSIILGLISFGMFIKIFNPKVKIIDSIMTFLMAFWV